MVHGPGHCNAQKIGILQKNLSHKVRLIENLTNSFPEEALEFVFRKGIRPLYGMPKAVIGPSRHCHRLRRTDAAIEDMESFVYI